MIKHSPPTTSTQGATQLQEELGCIAGLLIRHSWHVFPVGGLGKQPLWSQSSGGGRWGCTSDAEEITSLWPGDKVTGVGVALGESGLVVIDFDPDTDSDLEWCEATRARLGLSGVGLEVRTGRGLQLWFLQPVSPVGCSNGFVRLLQGSVDVKGEGGFALAPGSLHVRTGRRYEATGGALCPLPPTTPGMPPWPTPGPRRTLAGPPPGPDEPGRPISAGEILQALSRRRGPYPAAVRRALNGIQPWPAKGEPGAPPGHDFARNLACWLADLLPIDVDPHSVEAVIFEGTGAMAQLRTAVERQGGTAREVPGYFADLFASAQDVVTAKRDGDPAGIETDPETGKPVQIPPRRWFTQWRGERHVEYHPKSRGASVNGEHMRIERLLSELRLDAAESGRTDGPQVWTDVFTSWLTGARETHRLTLLDRIAYRPGSSKERVKDLADTATGRDVDAREVAVWEHWLWASKRRMLGLPVEHHLWLHLWGKQGSGKSTLVRRLFEPIKDETIQTVDVGKIQDTRCAYMFSDNLMVFFDEMAKVKKVEAEAIKAVISGEHIDSRAMYTRVVESVPIRCGFISAANEPLADLIKDNTGNRRFFEVLTPDQLDYAAVNGLDILGIWQCVDERGPAPLLSAEGALEHLRAEQAEARYEGPVEAWVSEHLDTAGSLPALPEHAPGWEWVPTTRLYDQARQWCERYGWARGTAEGWRMPTGPAFGRALSTILGQASSRQFAGGRRLRGYWIYRLPGTEPPSAAKASIALRAATKPN